MKREQKKNQQVQVPVQATVQARKLLVRAPPATSCSVSVDRLRTVSRFSSSFRLTFAVASFVFILIIFFSKVLGPCNMLGRY